MSVVGVSVPCPPEITITVFILLHCAILKCVQACNLHFSILHFHLETSKNVILNKTPAYAVLASKLPKIQLRFPSYVVYLISVQSQGGRGMERVRHRLIGNVLTV